MMSFKESGAIIVDSGIALAVERRFVIGQRHSQRMCHSEGDNTENTNLAEVHGAVVVAEPVASKEIEKKNTKTEAENVLFRRAVLLERVA